MKLTTAREKCDRVISEFLTNPVQGITVASVTMGIGKTYSLLHNLDKVAAGARVVIGFRTKAKMREAFMGPKTGKEAIMAVGRCKDNCEKWEQLKNVYALGLDPKFIICDCCGLNKKCKFFKDFAKCKEFDIVFTTHQMVPAIIRQLKDKPHLAVYDEDPTEVFNDRITVSMGEMEQFFDKIGFEGRRLPCEDLEKLVADHKGGFTVAGYDVEDTTGMKHNYVQIKTLCSTDWGTSHDFWSKVRGKMVECGLGEMKKGRFTLNHKKMFEMGADKAVSVIIEASVRDELFYSVNHNREGRIYRTSTTLPRVPVLVLDGTYIEGVYPVKKVRKITVNPKYKNKYFIKCRLGKGATLTKEGIEKYEVFLDKALSLVKGKILVVAKKNLIIDEVPDGKKVPTEFRNKYQQVDFITFGDVLGYNEFEKHDAVIVLGNHNMNPEEEVINYMALHKGKFNMDKFIKNSIQRRVGAMEQAVHRLRQVQRDGECEVVLCISDDYLDCEVITPPKFRRMKTVKNNDVLFAQVETIIKLFGECNQVDLGKSNGVEYSRKQWYVICSRLKQAGYNIVKGGYNNLKSIVKK